MSFIDRNPDQMLKYAKEARNIIGEMTLIIRKVEGILDAYALDLDEPTQKKIHELHECCNEYFHQIEAYQNIADNIFLKGKNLKDLRNGEY